MRALRPGSPKPVWFPWPAHRLRAQRNDRRRLAARRHVRGQCLAHRAPRRIRERRLTQRRSRDAVGCAARRGRRIDERSTFVGLGRKVVARRVLRRGPVSWRRRRPVGSPEVVRGRHVRLLGHARRLERHRLIGRAPARCRLRRARLVFRKHAGLIRRLLLDRRRVGRPDRPARGRGPRSARDVAGGRGSSRSRVASSRPAPTL